MMLAFARALGEFGATITFVSNIPGETQTISAAIYTLTQVPGGDAAALQLVVVAVIISLARAGRLGVVRAPRHRAAARSLTHADGRRRKAARRIRARTPPSKAQAA